MWISIEVSPLIWVLAIHDIIPNNLYQNNLEVLINIQVPTFQFGIFKLESQVGDLRISIKKKKYPGDYFAQWSLKTSEQDIYFSMWYGHNQLQSFN